MGEKEHKIIMDELKTHIADVIKSTVNGKIDKQAQDMKTFLESFTIASREQVKYNEGSRKLLTDYIVRDEEWKTENEPYLKGLANLTGGAKIVVWVAIAIGSISGAWLAIKSLF